jgi:hypothetical protein
MPKCAKCCQRKWQRSNSSVNINEVQNEFEREFLYTEVANTFAHANDNPYAGTQRDRHKEVFFDEFAMR